ncbi:MAG: hypothetical protein RR472_03385, partial [Anaerovoracaceae bacterium]
YWVKNARVWDEAKRQYLTVDIRHRVTEISKAQSMVPNVDGYYLCFEPKQMPNFSMLGLDGVTINTEFFKAGTTNLADVKNRVVVKTNITYSDIDWNEGFYAPDVATDLDNKAVIGFITLENTATEAFLQVTENKVWRYSLNSDTNTGDPATSVGAYFDRSAYRTTYFSTNPRQILTVPKAGDPSGWTTAAYFQTLMGATEIRNTPPEISELKPQGNQTGKEAVKISAKFKDGNNDALRVSCQLTLPDGTVAYGTKGRISGEGIKDSETFWEKGGVIPQRSKGKEPAVLQITHGVTEKGEI